MRQTRTFGRFTSAFAVVGADEPSSTVLLSELAGSGTRLDTNAPFVLDDPGTLTVIVSGEVDLFFARIEPNGRRGARRYIGTLRAGEVVAGARAADVGGVIIAVGFGEATIRTAPITALDDQSPDAGRLLRALAAGLAETMGRAMYRASRAPARAVEPQPESVVLEQDITITAGADVVWVWIDNGTLLLGGDLPIERGQYVPLARGMWLAVASQTASLTIVDWRTAFDSRGARPALAAAWALFLRWTARWFDADDTAERIRLALKSEEEHERQSRALTRLASLLQPADATARQTLGDPLLDACDIVFRAAQITLHAPVERAARKSANPLRGERGRANDRVDSICDASRVRRRKVALRGDWWTRDCGPMLAFGAEGHAPRALLVVAGGYVIHDPVTGRRIAVSASVAATLEPFAFTFYRPAPGGPLKLRALIQLIGDDVLPDLRLVFVLVGAGAVLGLSLPIVTGKMFNEVIPSADMGNAIVLFAALVAMALGAAAFDAARALALVRVEGRSSAVMQAAIVDRLLALPAQFFRKYTVGDLTLRADAVNAAREMLTGVAVGSLLGGALTLTSLFLMFFINAKLALVAVATLAASGIATLAVGLYALPYERRRQTLHGEVSALVFEALGGIAKLHVAAAEPRVFALWGARFRELKVIAYRAGLGAAALIVFNDMVPLIASTVMFALAAKLAATPGVKLSTGDFTAFNAAFGGAIAAGVAVSNTLVSVLNIVPLLERAEPILAASPEINASRPDPGPISGRIEMSRVTFGYVADATPIIDDVSFEIRPGEFVAFVGPSGAGKSTILRLLLGFEQPARGAVYYDGKDLATLDVASIRRQAAVVLQQSRLLAGDIFTNIVGASPLTLDDAWQAAELAGVAADIRAMPMGMHTVVSEGGSTLSGGQRQRLLIARALVRDPRVVFFDEATSALDNRSQEVVTRSLEAMHASRIVIAHRLTTVQRADRIFVMQAGRIVQQGRYDELVASDGMFRQLAARQLV